MAEAIGYPTNESLLITRQVLWFDGDGLVTTSRLYLFNCYFHLCNRTFVQLFNLVLEKIITTVSTKMAQGEPVTLEYKGRIAVITIDNEKKLNALTQDGYYLIAKFMREIATHDEVFVTVLTGKGMS